MNLNVLTSLAASTNSLEFTREVDAIVGSAKFTPLLWEELWSQEDRNQLLMEVKRLYGRERDGLLVWPDDALLNRARKLYFDTKDCHDLPISGDGYCYLRFWSLQDLPFHSPTSMWNFIASTLGPNPKVNSLLAMMLIFPPLKRMWECEVLHGVCHLEYGQQDLYHILDVISKEETVGWDQKSHSQTTIKYYSLQSLKEMCGRPVFQKRFLRTAQYPPADVYNAQRAGNDVEVVVMGRHRTLVPLTKRFNNVRHDVVLDVLAGGGDELLRSIGVRGDAGGLTPDFIDPSTRSVLELATSAISEEFSLEYEYRRKLFKYEDPVKRAKFSLMILIVSPTMVLSNFDLSTFEVNMLCLRVRIGLALEAKINELYGQNMFSDDLSDKEHAVETNLRKIEMIAQSEPLFDLSEIGNTTTQVSKEEKQVFKEALRQTLIESTKPSSEDDTTVRSYLDNFKEEECRTDLKRISPYPLIYHTQQCQHLRPLDPEQAEDMPPHLKQLWHDAKEVHTTTLKYHEILQEAQGKESWEQHRIQRQSAFNVNMSEDFKKACAESGVFGKMFEDDPRIISHRQHSQKSFHPKTNTDDIRDFLKMDILKSARSNVPVNIRKIIQATKSLWNKVSHGHTLFNDLLRTDLASFGQSVSTIMTEIAYCYRYWPKRSDFYHKEVDGVHILVRSTGTHIFVAFAFPECCSSVLDTGRLGAKIYFSDNYLFTDFCSFDEPTLEHFVKTGPYLVSIACHMLSHLDLAPNRSSFSNRYLNETILLILLLFLNNKTDAEELITSQRYLVMGVLEELDPNPYRFCSRLPEILRSRLTVFLLQRTLSLMDHYSHHRISKTIDSSFGKPEIKHIGLKSLFSGKELDLRQQVNEFYFGYVISKERGRGADRNFTIIKKIIKEEYDARDTVVATFSRSLKRQKFVSNPIIIKVFMDLFKKHLNQLYGSSWKEVLKRQVIRQLSGATFSELATLKVASRSYKEKIIVPYYTEEQSTDEIKKELIKLNPEESEKRPKVMEALSELVSGYMVKERRSPMHLSEILPYCFNSIKDKGYFITDLFIKPQHGGDREIHVLEIAARVCQYHLEGIARAISRMVPEDSLTHPKSKDFFMSNHHKKAEEELGQSYFTLGKSADATKWCQRNHCSKFACFLMPLLDKLFWKFVLSMLWLWLYKRMSFPVQFAANLMKNKKVQSDPLYKRFQKDFLEGTTIFDSAQNNKMMIKFGMMQGILHFVSTLMHVVIMVVMCSIVISYLKRKKIRATSSVISGSDDSAQLLSIEGKATIYKLRIATSMLHWKEKMMEYASVYANRTKCSIGTLDLLEYNSEWNIREHAIKPTFRWVSACMETTVVERFIDRIRTMYNTLSQVLEGGGKTLECAVIQMCQAWMHYMMLGLHTNPLKDDVTKMIWETKDPSLGFFPLDSDFTGGIVGVEFQLFHLIKTTSFSKVGYRVVDPELLNDDEIKDPSIPDSLRNVRLPFGSLKFWTSLLRRMDVPQLETIVEVIERNPLIVFENRPDWDHCRYQIYLKIFQPGVKESLGSYSPTIRMMAATSYLISKQCFSKFIRGENRVVKMSLYQLLEIELDQMKKRSLTSEDLKKSFPYCQEYEEMLSYINMLESRAHESRMNLKTSSKQRIMVFEKWIDDIPLVDMCRRQWGFSNSVPLSDKNFVKEWQEMKVKYTFLRDKLEDTCLFTEMNVIELKMFLESFTSKSRSIVLMDSAAKSANLKSAISRIFWPNTKLNLPLAQYETDSFSLRSDVFCILSFWGSSMWKKDQIKALLYCHDLASKPQVPSRIQKLHILSKWLRHGDNYETVKDLVRLNQGTLGFFLKRQEGVGKSRSGEGIWAGTTLGISFNIFMRVINGVNYCTEVVINKLNEPRVFGPILLDLIHDFHLKKQGIFSKAQYWLTDRGKIILGEGESNDIPIRVDEHLHVEQVDRLSELQWDWSVSNSKIRLVASLDDESKLTIMSDDYSNKDWDPVTPSALEGAVSKWSSSTPIPLNELEDEVVTATGSSFSSICLALADPARLTVSGWSLRSLVENLQAFYSTDPAVAESITISEISDDLDDLMNFINLQQSDEGDTDFDTDAEEDDPEDLFELDNVDVTDLEVQEEIFDAIPLQRFGPQGSIWGMPKFNRFFTGIDTLSRAIYGKPFLDLLNGPIRPVPGLLGILLTLLSKQDWCSGTSAEMSKIMETELDITSLTQSLASEQAYNKMDEEKLRQLFHELEETANSSSSLMQPLIRQQLLRVGRALVYKKRHAEPDSVGNFLLKDFFDRILMLQIEKIPRPELLQKMKPELQHAFLVSMLQSDLGFLEKSGKITPHEMALMVESLNQHSLTTLAMDAVWKAWGVGSSAGNYKAGKADIVL